MLLLDALSAGEQAALPIRASSSTLWIRRFMIDSPFIVAALSITRTAVCNTYLFAIPNGWQRPKNDTMPRWTHQRWPHNLNQTVSGKPGAVQTVQNLRKLAKLRPSLA